MFRFSLQTALKVRDIEEKKVMKELADLFETYQSIENKIDRCYRRMSEIDQKINDAKKSHDLRLAYFNQAQNFKSSTQYDIRNYQVKLEEFQKEINEKRAELNLKSKEKKTIEILKDKEYEKYLENVRRMENQLIDEVASVQHYYKHRS